MAEENLDRWKFCATEPHETGRWAYTSAVFASRDAVVPVADSTDPMATVLVVDDDVDVCGLLEAYLAMEGFDVLTACDGRDALRQLGDHQPAVILLDMMMPVMDGVEFRRHQQCDPRLRDIPVMCVSARHDAAQTAARLGLAGFVSKPFDLGAVSAAVRQLCAPCAGRSEASACEC
jgi:CheY-like chemotaxis protein